MVPLKNTFTGLMKITFTGLMLGVVAARSSSAVPRRTIRTIMNKPNGISR
jgi:hypothetical protein